MYIFDKDLNLLSEVHRIGWGENVKSVRFMGDIGFVVTYPPPNAPFNWDPLYAFDLSDPLKPIVLDELKIPGYSAYMHSWDKNHLLGLGVNTNDRGTRLGLKLSMFDVSDLENLAEKHVMLLGNSLSRSPYETDHRAALVSSERNIIGFPYMSNGVAYYAVFSYCATEGFRLVGEIRQESISVSTTYFCCSWCGDVTRTHTIPAQAFNRGLFIGNYIYAVSDNLIVSARMGDKLTEVQRLEI